MADDKLKANTDLEETVKRMQQANIHPVVEKIQHRFGILNLIRNSRNARQIAAESVDSGDQG